jgi:SulP family sulfate permease
VLASVVFTIAAGMIDVQSLSAIWRESRGEFFLALCTAVAVPGVGVEQGILLAIALSLVRHVQHSYRPHRMVLVPNAAGRWTPTPARPGIDTEQGLIVYRFGADLFYANADRFADDVRTLIDSAPAPVRWFVVDAGAVTNVDYSAARTVRDLVSELAAKNLRVAFGRVAPALHADLKRHGVSAALGDGRIFETLHEAIDAVRVETAKGGTVEAQQTKSASP